jgi:serine/threonine-protein kinase
MSFRPPSSGVLLDNKYRLAERIGGGGMGDVFRAEPVGGGRSVAVKFLHLELAQNSELSQRFFQEAQAVSRIRHTNVVEVTDAGVSDMGPYMVMEFLDGESVGAALLRVGKFDIDAAVGTCIPVLEALDAAHRAGIIHRDLKPENVFIAFDAARGIATVRLLDFGIAKMTDSNGPSPRTRTGVVFGTPDYLSPEQATGDTPLDGRSDLFAVGVLLFELLTGSRPFRGPTAVATAFRVVHAETPSLSSSGAHVDPKVEAIVQRLLQKDPAKRFPTAIEVIRELERIVPDVTRRVASLGRIINVARRMMPVAGASLREDTAASRERRSNPDLGYSMPLSARTMQSMPSSRGPDSPQRHEAMAPVVKAGPAPMPEATKSSPRGLPGDFPKTIRSALQGPISVSSRSEDPTTTLVGVGSGSSAPMGALTPVRALPQRFAGRFQVRGPVLRSVDKVIEDLFGLEARDEIVAQMPPAYAGDFRNGSINALVAYELEALDAYMEHATVLVVRDPGRWREIGRVAVDGELYNVVRTLLRTTPDLAAVLRRGTSIWARLFSFGGWRVAARPDGRAELHIVEFEPAAQPLRYWIAGVVEQTVRRAVRLDARVVITSGEQSFSPELVCEIG